MLLVQASWLFDSNLVGHDSHGVPRVGKYLEWMCGGRVKCEPDADACLRLDD